MWVRQHLRCLLMTYRSREKRYGRALLLILGEHGDEAVGMCSVMTSEVKRSEALHAGATTFLRTLLPLPATTMQTWQVSMKE